MKYILLITALLISQSKQVFAQSSWRDATTAPMGNRIDDIYFFDEQAAILGVNGSIYKTDDGAENWNRIGSLDKVAYVRSIEFINKDTGFIGTIFDPEGGTGFYKTINGGTDWTRIDSKVEGGMYGICGLDHLGNTIIGVGIYSEPGRFYISMDGGESWKGKLLPESAALVDCLMLNDSTYLVAGNSFPARKASIYKTTDFGETWKQVGISESLTSYCWKISINEKGFGIGSIEHSRTTLITEDFGDSWKEIYVDKNAPENLNLGGTAFLNDSLGWLGDQWDSGMYETNDGGKNWSFLAFGRAINKIKIINSEKAVAVGQTVYIYDKNILNTIPKTFQPPFHSLNINPNPVGNELKIDLILISRTAVRLDLLNENGDLIKTLTRNPMDSGKHKLNYNLNNLKSGTYIVWLRTNEGHITKKISVIN